MMHVTLGVICIVSQKFYLIYPYVTPVSVTLMHFVEVAKHTIGLFLSYIIFIISFPCHFMVKFCWGHLVSFSTGLVSELFYQCSSCLRNDMLQRRHLLDSTIGSHVHVYLSYNVVANVLE